jgi:hypothetical protein
MDIEPDLIDQSCFEERSRQISAAHDANVFPGRSS